MLMLPMRGYVFVELTRRCNLACQYCYNSSGPHRKSDEILSSTVLELLHQAKELGSTRCVLSGGEPMYHSQYERIALDSPLPIAVLTNGTLLAHWWRRNADVLRRPFEYRVSLDGTRAQEHLRGSKFDTVVEGLRLLRREAIPFSVNTMLTEQSLQDLTCLFDLMKELEPTAWRLDHVFSAGRQRESTASKQPDPRSMYPVLAALVERFLSEPTFKLEIANAFKPSMISSGFYLYKSKEHPCSYHLSNICVASDGQVIFCPSLPKKFGYALSESGLSNVLNSVKMSAFRARRVCDVRECDGCRYIYLCGTGCRADAFFSGRGTWGRDPKACAELSSFERYILPILPRNSQNAFQDGLFNGGWRPL